MGTPSLRQLDIFAQMVASGSIVRCARDLGLSIETVERDMDALEQRLGYRLFERAAGEARLTDAGRKTVQAMTLLSEQDASDWAEESPAQVRTIQAQNIQAEEARASDAAPAVDPVRVPLDSMTPPADEPARERQQVTIAAPAPVFSHFQDALTAFEQTSTDVVITLDLGVQIAPDAARAMALGTADITYFYALGAPEGFPSRYVWSEQLILYLGSDHELASRDLVHLSDLDALAPVTMDAQSGIRAIVEQALVKAGLTPRAPALESDNLFDVVSAVRDGAGYFAGFGPLARDFGRMPGVRRVPLADPLPAVEVRQAVRADVADDPIVSTLAEYLFR
ncbi:MAG: LysR family transcriptional regulator [Sphingobium sp.]|nr:LysR family transcriptional regulator [Sphingobium sp.]